MRPLERPFATWQPVTALDFSRTKVAADVNTVFGTTTPSITAVMKLLDDLVVAPRTLSAAEKAALRPLRDRLAREYRSSAPYLVDEFGSYCVYCETPLLDPVQVEHVVPKGQYPSFQLDWENLVPGCIGCNSRKRDQPKRSTAEGWTGLPNPADVDCRDEIRNNRYRWPDVSTHMVEGCVEIEFRYRGTSGNWQPCSATDAVASGTRFVSWSVVDGEVRADLPGLAQPLLDVAVAVVVVAATAGDTQTQATIDLCKLAAMPTVNGASDRRTLHRTRAWLTAVECLEPLAGSTPVTLPAAVRRTAAATGFFWTWLTVASALDPSLRTLVRDEVGGQDLPGTDMNRIS